MADEFVKNMLKSWNLSILQKNFEDNMITEDVFNNMDLRLIEKLIPILGYQHIFLNNYTKYKNFMSCPVVFSESKDLQLNCIIKNESIDENIDENIDESIDESIVESIDESVDNSLTDPNSNGLTNIVTNTILENNSNVESLISDHEKEREEFRTYLNSTYSGRVVLAEFKKTQKCNRRVLAKLLVKNEIILDKQYKIKKHQFESITKKIHLLFPNEDANVYYAPSHKSKTAVVTANCTGILYNYYLACRKQLKNAGLIPKGSSDESSVTNMGLQKVDSEGAQSALQWLQENTGPLNEEVLKKWRSTTKFRSLSKFVSIQEHINAFKYLQQSNGYLLFASDFDEKYPTNKNRFVEEWPKIAKAIIKLAYKDTKKTSEIKKYINAYSRYIENGNTDLIALILLPLMLGPITCKSKRDRRNWRPTVKQMQEGFLLHFQSYDELKIYQEAKQKIYNLTNESIQPCAVICGELDNIETCQICINPVTYHVPTPIAAINNLFKIFLTSNLSYPSESRHVWTFIQQFVFKVDLDNINNYITVNTLINNLDFELKSMLL